MQKYTHHSCISYTTTTRTRFVPSLLVPPPPIRLPHDDVGLLPPCVEDTLQFCLFDGRRSLIDWVFDFTSALACYSRLVLVRFFSYFFSLYFLFYFLFYFHFHFHVLLITPFAPSAFLRFGCLCLDAADTIWCGPGGLCVCIVVTPTLYEWAQSSYLRVKISSEVEGLDRVMIEEESPDRRR